MRFAAGKEEYEDFALLFLLTYAFLLRLPSEAVKVTAFGGGCGLAKEGEFLVLVLKRRKNKPQGSRLVRGCWCTESRETCPLHKLWPLLHARGKGERLFPKVTAGAALKALREILASIGIPRAAEYRTHDLRRGHAKDLQLSGRSL
jgi:hypothetical protein